MNEKQAKKLRKSVYAENDYRKRKYFKKLSKQIKDNKGNIIAEHFIILADKLRRIYQQIKKSMQC